ncbi:MAG: helix-turn-helix transcriptional regulator [Anderseniella sp.]|jgi:phage repressor protein C with HTH and peptisase S24 domain|nr:helix-turn-helix transcriptional regulator [Anderseniella sp.]
MFSHSQIWGALDKLAESKGMSVSALAKAAGLDATSFNKSKRVTSAGRKRWPTTESIAKCLNATGATLDEFTAMVEGVPATNRTIPVIGLAQAGGGGFFDDSGFPVGGGWDEINLPTVADPNAYALEISGDSMEPVYRKGDTIIVAPNATLRRGDRVVAKTRDGEVLAKVLERETARTVELASFNPSHPLRTLERHNIEWMARIVWASQ